MLPTTTTAITATSSSGITLLLTTILLLSSSSSLPRCLYTGVVAEQTEEDRSGFHNKEILLDLYQATGGLNWNDSTNWFQERTDICDWKGVSCYTDTEESDERRNGHIREINLKDNNLSGKVPPTVFEIPFLETINVEDNPNLDVDLSSIDKAQYLKHLSISKTGVSTIDNIGAASNLEILHMTDLGLQGKLPDSLYDLTSLVSLYANYNSFSGTISTRIGEMKGLDELYLYDSDLTGQIPTQIGQLTGLETLTLGQNAFGGSLPTELNYLTNLKLLAIQREDGKEKGNGISGPVPSFSNQRKLTSVLLNNQNLDSQLDKDFLLECPTSEKVSIDLRNNQLTGGVPGSLKNKAYLSLFLANNKIQVVAKDLYDPSTNQCPNTSNWMAGDVATLGCDAFLCPPGSWAPEGRSTTSDQCQACTEDVTFWGRTTCGGSTTPDNPDGLLLVLQNFYTELGGENWKNDNGWSHQETDVCQWYGISCTTDGKIESINLQNNNLNGKFSTSDIFSLQELRILNLSSNSIEFDLTGIGNAKKLETLDLSSTGLSSASLTASVLTELSSIPNLSILALDSNNIGGSLPSEIFSITSLQELSISHNGFTGELAAQVGTLSNLERFDCGGNKFIGQLPTQIGRLQVLQEFLAGENEFSGSLPTELNVLTRLRTMELQQVLATGGIGGPLLALRNLAQLTSLKLDSNQFTGSIPSDMLLNSRQLQSRIEISLSFNKLEGGLPAEWRRFDKMYVNLAGNKITEIASNLCEEGSWMDGDVSNYECDAILCPKGKYNSIGRQSDDESKCQACESGGKYLGATGCGQGSENDGFNGGGFDDPDASDITILTEFYASTGGLGWMKRDGWGDTADYCNWYGVMCDASKRVVQIDLTDNNLKGSVPSSIFNLDHIREIFLSKNEIAFSFDGIDKATKLDTLDLGETNLESIDGINDASKLVTLRLNGNNLKGAFPVTLYDLSNLQELNLGYNHISGRLPNGIGALTSLTMLRLYHNQFTGRLPAALGDLTRLQELNLAENNFDGTIPRALNDLSDLRFLSLQREGGILGKGDIGIFQAASSVSGPGLSGPLPAFEGLASIKEIYLGVNSLSGSIPFNFLDGIEGKSALIKIDLTSNRITGTLPGSLTQFDDLDLYVADNLISAIADGICIKSDWLGGDVGKFDCDGILCPVNTYSPGLGRKVDSVNPCQTCTTGTDGYMGSAQCLTVQQKKEGAQRAILEALYERLSGDRWLENSGWMDDDESICNWYGIKCVSDDNPAVVSIELESNNLQGTLNTGVFNLPNLQTLNLQGNMIHVSLNGIGNAKALEFLDLEDTGLTSVNGIDGATSLKNLRIGKNGMTSLPTEVFSLANLEVLEMSDNPFEEQEMPSGFADLSNLLHLGCVACGFKGAIPAWIGSMNNLEYLGLGQNGFEGSVGTELSTLTNLKHLDLSDQTANGYGLQGALPDFSQHTQLTELYLQNNEFSSTIPPTLLQNVRNDQLVTIDLRFNYLTGKVPTQLARFFELNIFLARNQIDNLPTVLCNNNWNGGNPSRHGCDAILCDVGSYNAYGRAIGDLGCSKCDGLSYFGSTYCGNTVEHSTLIEFYRDTGGTSWKSDENWLRNEDYCTWVGITCHEDGDFKGLVKDISLPDNNLVGTMPSYMWLILDGLESIDVQKNDLVVTFTTVMGAPRLESIVVSETKTKSLQGIGGAKALKSLHVTNAALTGSIPQDIFSLTLLRDLYLSHNSLSGTIPTNIGNLKSLQYLFMYDNGLNGFLPTELGYLARLKSLSLGENRFIGNIPRQITALPLLEVLSLQKEQDPACEGFFCVGGGGGLTGTVPALDGLPRIKEVYLAHNKFTGTVPGNFLQGVQDKSQEIFVDLTFNNVEGIIPKELESFDDLQLLLAGNLVDGISDEICQKKEWFNGEVANGCDTILCSNGTFNEYGRRIDAKTPCQVCTYPGSAIHYGSTECGPVLVDEVFNDRKILFELYDATGGSKWKNKKGWLKQNVNECDWFGVTCEPIGEFGTMVVTELDLSDNNLDGIIPSLLFHMPDLKKLDVRYNDVEMRFYAIYRSEALEELWLDDTLVPTLNGIGRASSLKSLHLSNVSLGWEQIPDEMFEIQSLTDLDLSHAMLGGSLPTKIGSMTNLERLFLAGNGLKGEIPSELGLLDSLEELSLSNNNWVGTLPETLNALTSLKSFHLDNSNGNKAGLSGNLLPFSAMPDLTELQLSNNQFTGTIPGNFLVAAANRTSEVTVSLEKNHLVGTIPSSLSALSKLNIYLTDNLITGIGDGLCANTEWLDGFVGTYNCDAILCPPGKFSSKGRQDSTESECKPCPGDENSKVFGSSFCLSVEKEREKEILGNLYDSTGGKDWHNSDMWKDDAFDYCKWYGITCSPDSTVESIILGSNHLVGTVPTEVFQLASLKNLWLYSNPISFSFDGISQATNLRSLVLDSTKLKSLEGIGNARSLKDLDIRFNNLAGPLPAGIAALTNMQTLICSDNAFTGPVPELTSVPTLKTLRLGNNKFTGTLPSFSRHTVLESVDLSKNKLEGTISSTLLGASDTDLSIYLDLSGNKLRGEIPSELSRFSDMTLLLRENLIEGIPPELCSQTSWNGGDVGNFGCDGILCPPGTVSTFGRASRKLDAECESCESTHFGQTHCASAVILGRTTILLLSMSIITISCGLLM